MQLVDEWGNWTLEANRAVSRLEEKFTKIIAEEVEGFTTQEAKTIARFLAPDAAHTASLNVAMKINLGKINTIDPHESI